MAKVRYKEISQSLANLAKPNIESSSRISIGLEKNVDEYYFLDIDDLVPFKNQARQSFPEGELKNLSQSIKLHGIRQPLTVITCDENKGKFQIVSGERRYRAAKMAGILKVPCIILKEKELADEVAIVENIHRKDLHPVELGMALSYLLKSKFFKNQQEIANKLSLSKSTICEYLQYSNFDDETRKYLIEHNITSQAKLRKLVQVKGNKEEIRQVLGLTSTNVNFKPISVLRIFLLGHDFKTQSKGLKKLDKIMKQALKKKLEKLIIELS